ncbi:YcjF family protein [Profundibacterium mesophilum]|uniref:Membrane protein n=1 Tax=Profundibacterium mesophilum KAUST100406-0324 TaxID=1037889 RepID=A0A921TDR7_9RHOB|nr:TIGR01620 family protein [Profundibacterium mesophilum]KAF0676606.1 membrane protein [Profundibacterium mesophilum KAUST100406-0324]
MMAASPSAGPRGPILIEDDMPGAERPGPAEAPPVPDLPQGAPDGAAMRSMAALATRRSTALGRWFWRLLGALAVLSISLAGWAAIDALITAQPVLGMIALALAAAFVAVCLLIVLREALALRRLARLDHLHTAAAAALAGNDLPAARAVTGELAGLYAAREELRWGRERLAERSAEAFDADGLFHLAEAELLAPLDAAARLEVEAAARQVAMVTAIVPLALADVVSALGANLRMIRRIAEIYGGRGGTLGSWRLTRAVMTHLVATGAVAVGDDLIGSVAGGSVLSKLSRRFGEGIVNGALTARVGVAAMEVCRPLPFSGQKRPQIHAVVSRALTGLFGGAGR